MVCAFQTIPACRSEVCSFYDSGDELCRSIIWFAPLQRLFRDFICCDRHYEFGPKRHYYIWTIPTSTNPSFGRDTWLTLMLFHAYDLMGIILAYDGHGSFVQKLPS